MALTTTPLLGGGTLVEGTDITGKAGRTVLQSDKWEMYQHTLAHVEAEKLFGEAVDNLFAPLIEAADRATALLAKPGNEYRTIVVKEGTEYEPAEVIKLDADGILLRLLAEGKEDLLRWIGEDVLVAIAQ